MRRITMVGHDGSHHSFAVQVPSPRTARREERIGQFFRLLNGQVPFLQFFRYLALTLLNSTLAHHKDTRRRRLDFNIPVIMPVSSHVRLVQNDASMITLQDIYEQHAKMMGKEREYAVMQFVDKLRAIHEAKGGLVRTGAFSSIFNASDSINLAKGRRSRSCSPRSL